MFTTLLHHIKYDQHPVTLFRVYQGTDWMEKVHLRHGYPTTTIFQNSLYQLDVHHWLHTYNIPYTSSYTGSHTEHIKMLSGHAKLITLLPDSSTYAIRALPQQAYAYLPPDTDWLLSSLSPMTYYLRLIVKK